jgi:multiple sugar transport system permease protein
MSVLGQSEGLSPSVAHPRGSARAEHWVDRNLDWLFPAPTVAVIFLIIVFPLLYTIWMSLHNWYASSTVAPSFIWFKNYIDILSGDGRFWLALWRTLLFTAVAVTIQTVLGVGMALVFNREFAGKGLARTLFLLPMMATPAAIALIWVLMMNPTLGVLNHLLSLVGLPPQLWVSDRRTALWALALVDTWEWTPLITLIALAGLSVLPQEPYEAARIDGASPWQLLWQITLPLLRPTIVVAVLFRSIDALKTFDIIYVMTQGGPGDASETMNIYIYLTAFQYLQMGYASALLVLFFAVVLGVSLMFIRVRRAAW